MDELENAEKTEEASATSVEQGVEATATEEGTPSEASEKVKFAIEGGEPSKTKRRINQLLKERAEYRDAFYKTQERLARLEGEMVGMRGQGTTTSQDTPPNPEQFDTQEDYIRAYIAYTTDRAVAQKLGAELQKRDQQQAEISRKAEYDSLIKNYHTRVLSEAETKYPDWFEVVNSIDEPISEFIADAVIRSEAGVDIQYYLSKYPQELRKINSLPPSSQLLALGRLEAQFLTGGKSPEKKVTNAPPPITTVKPTGGVPDISKMSMKDWVDYRNRVEAEKRRGGG